MLNKWRDFPCSEVGKLNKTMSVLPDNMEWVFLACLAWNGTTASWAGGGVTGASGVPHPRQTSGSWEEEKSLHCWSHLPGNQPQQQAAGLDEKCRNSAPSMKKVLLLGAKENQPGKSSCTTIMPEVSICNLTFEWFTSYFQLFIISYNQPETDLKTFTSGGDTTQF